MIRFQLWAFSLVIVALCYGVNQAQQSSSTSENEQTADARLREKAFALLESLSGQLTTLQSPENRARIGSNIAESLWNHDEKRARSLLALAEDNIKIGLQDLDPTNPGDARAFATILKLRADIVDRIARHDAGLALAFLTATEPRSDLPSYAVTNSQRELEMRLAKQIASDNPDVALKLGRQTLARGFANDLLPLLSQLSRKHRDQALLLYKEIVTKLRDVDLAHDTEASDFAQNLAHAFTPPAADDATFKELIGMFTTAALANGCGNKMSDEDERVTFCSQVGSLLRQIEKIDPARAAKLKQWASEDQDDDSSRKGTDEAAEVIQNGTVEEILALATKYPEMQFDIYLRAIIRAEELGDLERARKLAADYPGEPAQRQALIARIERNQAWDSVTDEQVAQIQKTVTNSPRAQDRVSFLIYAAGRMGPDNRKAALMLLDQASGIVDTLKPGREQTQAQIGLAMMYCLHRSDRGLSIMESLIPKLNDLVAASVKLDGYDGNYLSAGEWNMTGEGSAGNLLTGLAQNAVYFAWCDFDRAVSMSAAFERPEIRLMAQVKLGQGVLAGPPKRIQTNRFAVF